MPKMSAAIMLYRRANTGVEVLLVHPGGPFWAKKDAGVWSLPKGEYEDGADVLVAAKREFREETGFDVPTQELSEIGQVKYNNKIVRIWAGEGSIDARRVHSNTFTMEWPPKTGRKQEFPEVDRAGWFTPGVAREKLTKGQVAAIDMLREKIGDELFGNGSKASDQLSLL